MQRNRFIKRIDIAVTELSNAVDQDGAPIDICNELNMIQAKLIGIRRRISLQDKEN